MAAARRSSESKALVFMIVFLLLAVAAICTTVAFYQKYANVKVAVDKDQAAINQSIGAVFQENGWQLDEYNPPELGFRYKPEAYGQVGAKLKEATEYEKQVLPLLGWDSLSGLQAAMKDSPAQSQNPLSTMKALLGYYETTTAQQSSTVSDLRGQVSAVTKQKDALQTNLDQREKDFNQQVGDLQKKQADELAKVKKDYDDMVSSFDAQRQKAQETDAKLQQEVSVHKADTSKFQDQITTLRDQIRKLTVPGQGTQLTAEGKVISIESQYDVAFIDGGKDKNRKENDTFVVYSKAPDGTDSYKGTVKVTDVSDTTSRSSIVQEQANNPILAGDSFVSTQQWDMFHPSKAAAPAAASAAAAGG